MLVIALAVLAIVAFAVFEEGEDMQIVKWSNFGNVKDGMFIVYEVRV